MMGDISNGTRILLTQYLLKRLTDEDHALSRDDLINKIGGLGTTISSNTIKADIESIKNYNKLICDFKTELLNPFEINESGDISYATKQKKGAFVEKTYYSDAQLILLTRLLMKGLNSSNEEKNILEKVLAESSLYKINHYHLLDKHDVTSDDSNIVQCIEQIIKTINNFGCVSFKKVEYGVIDNQICDIVNHKTVLVYPTNIDIINGNLYLVGYLISNGEEFELAYYRLDRISHLKVIRTPRNIQSRIECFKDRIWTSNDPLGIAKTNLVKLELRVYLSDINTIDIIYERFKNCPFEVERFRQFIDLSIDCVANDESLVKFFLQLSNHVEVFKPLELRDKLKDEVRLMYLMYRN